LRTPIWNRLKVDGVSGERIMPGRSTITALFRNRWRTLLAGVGGVAAGWTAYHAGLLIGASFLIGWNAAAGLFVVSTGWLLLMSEEAEMRERARLDDENRAVLMSIVLGSVGASLVAIVIALKEAKIHAGHGGEPLWVLGLSASTLALSWLVVQCLYTLHYTHRYFGDRDADGKVDGGIKFPGDDPTTYRDFIYVSICIGATCQVSDFDIVTSKFRNLVTTHSIISFIFNTMVLALGINIIGNLMGQ
jgi:uncharacterized membrane protein